MKYSSSCFFFPETNPLQYCLQQCTLKSLKMLAVAFFKYCTNYSLIKWKQNHECYVFFLRELGTVLAVDCILAKVQPAIGE